MLIDLLSDDMKLHEYFSIEGAKTPYALAKFLGITPANVYDWLKNGRPIPINHCARIEKFTNNLVSCEELAPNFRWNELWNIYELRQEKINRDRALLVASSRKRCSNEFERLLFVSKRSWGC